MINEHQGHGYVDCSCRDCFDVAMCCAGCDEDHDHHLCSLCAEAGCEAWPGEGAEEKGYDYECQRDDAYGQDEEEG